MPPTRNRRPRAIRIRPRGTCSGATTRRRRSWMARRAGRSDCYHPPRLKVSETSLPGVLLIEPDVFGDSRGFFMETWNAARFREAGLDLQFVQDNQSRSARGVLRGLHFQEPNAQGKLVRCTRGALFDVAVDVRVGSPTFAKWFGLELSEENKRMLRVPAGFAHGFCALTDI